MAMSPNVYDPPLLNEGEEIRSVAPGNVRTALYIRSPFLKHCGIDLDSWLHEFDDTQTAILETVDLVKNHPLVSKDVVVHGYIMDSETGALTPIK